MTLGTDYIFPVQAPTGGAPLKTTIGDALGLASASSLEAVTTVGNTSTKDILLKAGDATTLTLAAGTGAVTASGDILVGSGATQIKLNAATGEITAYDLITTGPVQAPAVTAGSGDTAIVLDGETGQVGSDDDSNFMDGGTYAS